MVVEKIKTVPNVVSWRTTTISVSYNKSLAMETDVIYGWDNTGNNIDTHMMKNTEWGAVAYLSKSIYGIKGEIWINTANDYTTGCAGNTVNAGYTVGCINAYNTINGVKASTTGNITGIYDISGGAYEFVMGNIDNLPGTSGLNPSLIPDKYIDRYNSSNNYSYNNTYFGDAFFETSFNPYINGVGNTNGAWYRDHSFTPDTSGPWFTRGGHYNHGSAAGVFYFYGRSGGAHVLCGFRPSLIVESGL